MEIGRRIPPITWFGRFISAADGPASKPTRRDRLLILRDRLKSGAPLPTTAAIPDVHGNYLALQRIYHQLKDSAAEKIPMGDEFDRRYGNLHVFQMLRKEKLVLLGNHEIYQMLAMRGDLDSFISWAVYGGKTFFEECGIDGRILWPLYAKLRARAPQNTPPEDILFQVYRDYPGLLEQMAIQAMQNPLLQEVFEWLVERGHLYYLDENGILYIHGGVPEGCAYPGLLEQLDCLEQDFKGLLTSPRPSFKQVKLLKDQLLSFLSARGKEFINPLKLEGDAAVYGYLRSMGVTGLVCAHTIKKQVEVTAGRIFEIDLGMANHNEGSFFTIGSGGPKSYRETDNGLFSEETLIEEGAWREQMLRSVDDLLT